MAHPYRHQAPRPDLTARPWSVSEWQKVAVRAMQWLPWTRACRRWRLVQVRRVMACERAQRAALVAPRIQAYIDAMERIFE